MEIVELRAKLATAYTDGSTDEVVADLEAQLATAKQAEAKTKAEAQRLEVEAKQSERQAIVDDCKDWVKFCKKLKCGVITVDWGAVVTAEAIIELLKVQPNIIDRVYAAKGLALQYKPADSTSDVARVLVTVTATKTAKKGGNGGNRGGKLIAIFERFATDAEKSALETALVPLRAKGARLDSVENKHRVDVKKRCLEAGLITAE